MDILSSYLRPLKIPQNFREDYVTPELKEWSRELGGPLNSYSWSMLKIFVYIRSSAVTIGSLEVGSQLLSDIENLGSALSWKVRSAILILRLSFRWNCNEASGGKRGLYVLCERARVCICMYVFESEYPILRRKLSQVSQKRLNCYRQSPKFFINWCQLLEMETC